MPRMASRTDTTETKRDILKGNLAYEAECTDKE